MADPERSTTDRGVSEVVSFAMVFTIIILTVGLVAATGFGGLEAVREHERTNNAERALGVLAANVDDVSDERVPSRSTEVHLDGAALSQERTVTFTVSGHRTTNPHENFSYTFTVHPVVYEGVDGQRLVYVSGAVFRASEDGAAMVREPAFRFTTDSWVLPLVRTYPQGTSRVGGTTTVQVLTRRTDSRLLALVDSAYEVNLTVTSPRAGAWARYLDAQPGVDCSRPATDTVTCGTTVQRAIVTVDHVAVRFT